MSKHSQTNAELEVKNQRLLAEVEKSHSQLLRTQDELAAMREQLDNKKYDRQTRAWAVDRALQGLKRPEFTVSAADVIKYAQELTAWVYDAPDAPPTETVN